MKIHPIWLLLACLLLPAHASHAQTARPKVALVLGGGGAKGAAHVGVLRWLQDHQPEIYAYCAQALTAKKAKSSISVKV